MKRKNVTKQVIAMAAASSMVLAGMATVGTNRTYVLASDTDTVEVNPDAKSPVTAATVSKPDAAAALTQEEIGNGTVFVFSDTEIAEKKGESTGYEVSGTSLKITEAGTYYVSGSCSDGQIEVEASVTDVTLVLNGLTLTGNPAILVNKKAEVEIRLYGENALSDTAENSEKGVIVAKGAKSKLVIDGGGTLAIEGNYKNGIKANGTLVIDNGILEITAVNDGINNENAITINGGYLDIVAKEGDGIQSAADDEATGSITINGGAIVIDAYKDGIQALAGLTITDGYFDIVCCDGVSNTAYDKDEDDNSAKGIKAKGSYTDATSGEEVEVTGQSLAISGGTFFLDCADDAIASGGDVTLTGGYYDIKSGDDGIHAEYVTTIGSEGGSDSDLYVLVSTSFEGIEGAVVNINSGTNRVYATDDGINAANSDLASSNPTRFGQRYSGYDFQLNINGGNNYVSCMSGDGLDSNNSLTFTGGNTVVLSTLGQKSASSENGGGEGDALDCDGTLTVSGGQVLAIGTKSQAPSNYISFGSSSGSMGGGFGGGFGGGRGGSSSSSTSSVSIKQDDIVAVYDKSGNTVLATAAKWLSTGSSYSATYAVYSASGVTTSSGYTLKTNAYEFEEEEDTSASEAPTASSSPSASAGTAASSRPSASADTASSSKPSASEDIAASSSPSASADTASSSTPGVSTDPGATNEPVTSETPATGEPSYKTGDVNHDGEIDLDDAQIVLKMALKITTDGDRELADADSDGDITLDDALIVLKKALKIER